MITSHELLEFIESCTEEELTLDASGDVLSRVLPVLKDDALATAVKAVASLAVAEHDAALQNRSLDAHIEKDAMKGTPSSDRGYM